MAKKLSLEQVRATAREPNPDRFREPQEQQPAAPRPEPVEGAKAPRKGKGKGRTAIPLGVSLFPEEQAELDNLVASLRRGGLAGANRSFVVREALQRLKEETRGMGDAERAASFLTREAKRRSA
jgi:hypothetical protein